MAIMRTLAILPFKRYIQYDQLVVHEFIYFNDTTLMCIDVDEAGDLEEQVAEFVAADGYTLEEVQCVDNLILAHVSGFGEVMHDAAPNADCVVRRAVYDTYAPLDYDADEWQAPADLHTSFKEYYKRLLAGESGFGFPEGGVTMFGQHVPWASIIPHLATCGADDELEEKMQGLTV